MTLQTTNVAHNVAAPSIGGTGTATMAGHFSGASPGDLFAVLMQQMAVTPDAVDTALFSSSSNEGKMNSDGLENSDNPAAGAAGLMMMLLAQARASLGEHMPQGMHSGKENLEQLSGRWSTLSGQLSNALPNSLPGQLASPLSGQLSGQLASQLASQLPRSMFGQMGENMASLAGTITENLSN